MAPFFSRRLLLSSLMASAAIVAYLGGLALFQHKLIYHPRKYEEMKQYYQQFIRRPNLETITFQAGGATHKAYFWRMRSPSAPQNRPALKRLWLCLGGNAGLALDWGHLIDDYQRYVSERSSGHYDSPSDHEETGFLLVDYPGYDENPGSPSPASILESTHEALTQFMQTQQFQPGHQLRVGFVAHSIGCAASLQLADSLTRPATLTRLGHSSLIVPPFIIDRLVLLSPFTTLIEVAHHLIGPIPFLSYFLNHNFDNLFHLSRFLAHHGATNPAIMRAGDVKENQSAQVAAPSHPVQIFIGHGSLDRIVPVSMGRRLSALCELAGADRVRVVYREYERADHNDIIGHAEQEIFNMMAQTEIEDEEKSVGEAKL